MHLPGFFRDAGDGETAQAPRGAGVGLDAVPELDRFGRRRHAADGGGGVQVVTQQSRVERLPATPGVPHGHDVGDQHMVVRLGVATLELSRGGTRPR